MDDKKDLEQPSENKIDEEIKKLTPKELAEMLFRKPKKNYK